MADRITEYSEQISRSDRPGRIVAKIELVLSHEDERAPSVKTCRYGVLEIVNGSPRPAYVVYDRILNRIADGVYYMPLADVLAIAADLNGRLSEPYEWRAPNGVALGLHYPKETSDDGA